MTSTDPGPDRPLPVGELARATGLTVRALHHYDRIGLLSPARDQHGHRCYGRAEVRRLHQILALRGFGLSLAEIARLLDGDGADPRELLQRQLEQTEERIAAAQRLRATLLDAIGALTPVGDETGPSAGQLMELIEVMTAMDRKFTPEQLEQMTQQRKEMMERLTPEELDRLQRHREEAMSRLSPEELAEMHRRRQRMLPDDTA
jgi:DNA-binding transcriptional MerR regulator